MKRYLYENLVDALSSFHREKQADLQIQQLVTQAGLLAEKQLHSQALSRLEKAAKLAVATGDLNAQLRIMEKQEEILFDTLDLSQLRKLSAEFETRRKRILEQLAIRHKYRDLYHKTADLHYSGSAVKAARIGKLAAKVNTRELEKAGSYKTFVHGFTVLEKWHEANCRTGLTSRIERKLLEKLRPHLAQTDAYDDFLIIYHNLVNSLIKSAKFPEAIKELDEMMTHLPNLSGIRQLNLKLYGYNLRQLLCLSQDKMTELLQLSAGYAKEVPEEVIRKSGYYHIWIQQKYAFAYAAFRCRKYRECIRLLFDIESAPNQFIGRHIQLEALALKTLAHYELGDEELARNLVGRYRKLLGPVPVEKQPASALVVNGVEQVISRKDPSPWKKVAAGLKADSDRRKPEDKNPYPLDQWAEEKAGRL
jgi:hypothetical protein